MLKKEYSEELIDFGLKRVLDSCRFALVKDCTSYTSILIESISKMVVTMIDKMQKHHKKEIEDIKKELVQKYKFQYEDTIDVSNAKILYLNKSVKDLEEKLFKTHGLNKLLEGELIEARTKILHLTTDPEKDSVNEMRKMYLEVDKHLYES